MDSAARQIRRRIIWLILRAFIGVVLVTLLTVIIFTGIVVNSNLDISPLNNLSVASRLEGYYVGRGGWDGAQTILQDENPFAGNKLVISDKLTLLDATGRILLDHGANDTANVGTLYQPSPNKTTLKLDVDGEMIGIIVLDNETSPSRLAEISPILGPVTLVAIVLAFLAILVVSLLSRHIVNPLAEVIAASHAVTAGKLDARVQLQGPQDLLVLTDSFNQMAAALERNDRERRELLTDIAHELRTPISAIRGRLEGMLDGIYPADKQYLSLALKSNYQLEQLVEDLRLLTLAESRQLHFEKKETDLKTLSEHILEIFGAEAQEKDIKLELLPTAGEFVAILDPQRSEQIFGNLIGNALRYVPAGGKVWITIEQSAEYIILSVNDNGPGISESDLPYIFNRFWRKEKSRTRQSGGSGLGLAIAKQFIEAQGGFIRAKNLPTGGLKLSVGFLKG